MAARKHVFRVPCSVKEVDRAVDVRAARDSALMFLRTVAGAQLSQQTEKLYSDPRFFETLEAFSRDLLLAEGEPDETAFRESLAYQPGWKREQEAISLLKAEWSVLTQPARLQDLVERHADVLKLAPMTAEHIGTLADIPAKPAPIMPDVNAPIGIVPTAPEAQNSASAADLVGDDDDAIR